MVENYVPEMRKLLKNEILSPMKATWNTMQAEKVNEHEHSLVVFGYNATGNLIEAAGELLSNHLKISADNLLRTAF